jgi:hypothetical protein
MFQSLFDIAMVLGDPYVVMTIVRHVYSQIRDNISSKVLPCDDPSLPTLLSLLAFGLESRRGSGEGASSKIDPPGSQDELIHVFLPSLMYHIASERIMKETVNVSHSTSEDIKKQWLACLVAYWSKRRGEEKEKEKKGKKKKSKESEVSEAVAFTLTTVPTLMEPYSLSLCTFVGTSPVAQMLTLYHTFYSVHNKSVSEMRYIAQLLEDGIGQVYSSAEAEKYQPASVILKILKNVLHPPHPSSSGPTPLPLPLPTPSLSLSSSSSSSALSEEMSMLLAEMMRHIETPAAL